MTQSGESDNLVTRADLDAAFVYMEDTEEAEDMGLDGVDLPEWLADTVLGTEGHPDSHDFNLGLIVGLSLGVVAERFRVRRSLQ